MNAVFPQEVDVRGVGVYFQCRDVYGAASQDDVIRRLGAHRSATGGSLNVGVIGEGLVKNIEWGPAPTTPSGGNNANQGGARALTPVAVTAITRGTVGLHMNEFLHLAGVAFRKDTSSEHRLARARAIVAASQAPFDGAHVASFWKVLGDTADPLYPLYRNATAPDDSATAATATFVLGEDEQPAVLIVKANGNPAGPATATRKYLMA
eukprot:g4222.t1